MNRTDKTHAPIRDELRKRGYTVFDTSQSKLADMVVVLKSGRAALIVEAKTDLGSGFTPNEIKTAYNLIMVQPVYRIFFSPEEALQAVSDAESEL